jgi:hypothetical protein
VQPFKTVVLKEWGGLNEDENPSSLEPGELTECSNAAPYGRSMGTRPGVNREATGGDYVDKIASGGNNTVKGLYHFSKRTDFQRDKLIAVVNKQIYVDDDNANRITQGASCDIPSSGDNVHTFAQYRGNVFLAGYVQNIAGATIHWWDGAAATFSALQIDNVIPLPIPNAKYLISKWGYLFVSGFQGGTLGNVSNPMVVRFNDIGADETTTIAWPPANTIGTGIAVGSVGGLREYGGEFITGLAEFQDNEGDWLLILTSHRLVAVIRDRFQVVASGDPFIVHSSIANGCVHQNAYVNLGLDYGDAIYVSHRGIHSVRQSQEYGGRDDTFLSWKIRRTFETINRSRMQYIVGGYDQNEGYVLFAVPTGSSTKNDTILCLDVRDKASITAGKAKWYVWKLSGSERVTSMASAPDGNDFPRLFVGGDEGSVGFWSRSEYTDFGSGFQVSWTDKHEDFGVPSLEKASGDMTVDVQPGGTYSPTVTTVFDFGAKQGPAHALTMGTTGALWEDHTDPAGPTTWDFFDWAAGDIVTVRHKLYDVGRGTTIASRFAHVGTNQPFFIAGQARQVSGVTETIGIGEGAA